MNKPLFSILVANYNNACFLQDAIDSVLSQTYTNWQAVIVDDCSSDNPHPILEKYASDSRFKIVYNDRNRGCGFTKDRCVRESDGELCGFLDPDDKLESNAIQVMVEASLNNPEVVMFYSNHYETDENFNIEHVFKSRKIDEGETILSSKCWPLSHFVAFKRSAYVLSDGIDVIMRRCVDYDMYYRLEEMGPIMYIDDCLYRYRRTSNSISVGDNSFKASAWHIYACVNAMKRRNLEDESLMLFPMKGAMDTEGDIVKNTTTFKVGKLIIWPFGLVKRLLEKKAD